jgi:Dna[CI] antecedent DciA-like protein
MLPVRDFLPGEIWKGMQRKLGREEALRLLWPAVVGPKLAAQMQFGRMRGEVLSVSVPDTEVLRGLQPMGRMILEAVNRFRGQSPATSIEFAVASRPSGVPSIPAAPLALARPPKTTARLGQIPAQTISRDIAAGAIADTGLRDLFIRSAQKYFSR